jgi:ABC-2 type transport system permease protein
MPIFDQGYQHWNGRLRGRVWRWLAITRRGVRTQWEKKATRRVVFMGVVPALFLAAFLVLWGLFEQKSEFLAPIMMLLRGLPDELRSGPAKFRLPVWTIAFNRFLEVQTYFAMILVMLVGPDLISQDLRFGALPLYFSRPLRRFDYFVGKLGVIGVYLSVVTVAPILLAYVLGICFSLDAGTIRETAQLLGASIAWGLIVVASAGMLMLAMSSLSRNSRLVGGAWVGIWLVSHVAGSSLTSIVHEKWCPLVSYVHNLHRLREALLDTASAWHALPSFLSSSSRAFARTAQTVEYPWTWSAYVLAGLFGLSLCILSMRVRSLDRLK